MSEFIDWLNEGDLDTPVHLRASMAHLNLVKIHPWKDGNGRMSRALSTLVFSREALMPPEFSSIEEWLGRGQNTYAYYQVLEDVGGPHWSPERDTRPWIRFCLTAHHRRAQQAQRRFDVMSRAWTRLVEAVEATGLDERVVYALLPAFSDAKVAAPSTSRTPASVTSRPSAASGNLWPAAGSYPRARPAPATTLPALSWPRSATRSASPWSRTRTPTGGGAEPPAQPRQKGGHTAKWSIEMPCAPSSRYRRSRLRHRVKHLLRGCFAPYQGVLDRFSCRTWCGR